KLIGGQPAALQQRPGLVGINVKLHALLDAEINRRQRRAISRRRQRAGVAVREDVERIFPQGFEELKPVNSDRAVRLLVLLQKQKSFVENAPLDAFSPLPVHRERVSVRVLVRLEDTAGS